MALPFVHDNGAAGDFYEPELFGSGAALVDYDGDGDLDLYLVQGAGLGAGAAPTTDRLLRNDATPAGPAFVDVTRAAGLPAGGYGMGVAAGDYDGDGAVDLYVTRLGDNHLLRNRGDGTFAEVAAAAGAADRRWSAAALFLDYDADGRLDLYVGNYLNFSLGTHKRCRSALGLDDYCGPQAFEPEPDVLLRNAGDGSFADVSLASGIGRPRAPGLGAAAADFDGDGRLDLYVANDERPNFLWLQTAAGRFEDAALVAGAAVSGSGETEAGMGVLAEDLDDDGDEDLLVTHFRGETNTCYRNEGGFFVDVSAASGLGPGSLPWTGFGVVALDADGDGRRDVFVANGAVQVVEDLAAAGDPFPFHQPNLLFRGLGGGRFAAAAAPGDPLVERSEVSRGAAAGDVDNDGRDDLLVTNNAGPARLYLGATTAAGHWLGVRAVARPGGGDREGAVATWVAGGERRRRLLTAGGSYLSASDPRRLWRGGFSGTPVLELDSGGARWRFRGLAPDRYYTLYGDGGT